MARRFPAGVWFGELTQGKNNAPQYLLGQVVQEIALVFVRIETTQQLVSAVVPAVADSGVMPCGDAGQIAFMEGPIEHWAEFHGSIALRTRQWRDAMAVSIHQPLHNFSLERLTGVHHMVGDPELFADSRSVDKALCTAGTFPTHQPEG